MTTSSIIEVGALSATVTGVALMQLIAAGKVQLDADVSSYLGVSVRNPKFPNDPITLRALLTQTSSIVQNDLVLDALVESDAESKSTLPDLTQQYFVPSGKLYAASNFANATPGTSLAYCDVCVALVGRVVERVSGVPFALPRRGRGRRCDAKARLLSEASMSEMLREQAPVPAPGQGLIFSQASRNGAYLWGAIGELNGIAASTDFIAGTGDGAALFTNTDWVTLSDDAQEPIVVIEEKALALAAKPTP